jgi:hypothetical protein
MLVQRVLSPATRLESWTVLGDDGPVVPIERYQRLRRQLAHALGELRAAGLRDTLRTDT